MSGQGGNGGHGGQALGRAEQGLEKHKPSDKAEPIHGSEIKQADQNKVREDRSKYKQFRITGVGPDGKPQQPFQLVDHDHVHQDKRAAVLDKSKVVSKEFGHSDKNAQMDKNASLQDKSKIETKDHHENKTPSATPENVLQRIGHTVQQTGADMARNVEKSWNGAISNPYLATAERIAQHSPEIAVAAAKTFGDSINQSVQNSDFCKGATDLFNKTNQVGTAFAHTREAQALNQWGKDHPQQIADMALAANGDNASAMRLGHWAVTHPNEAMDLMRKMTAVGHDVATVGGAGAQAFGDSLHSTLSDPQYWRNAGEATKAVLTSPVAAGHHLLDSAIGVAGWCGKHPQQVSDMLQATQGNPFAAARLANWSKSHPEEAKQLGEGLTEIAKIGVNFIPYVGEVNMAYNLPGAVSTVSKSTDTIMHQGHGPETKETAEAKQAIQDAAGPIGLAAGVHVGFKAAGKFMPKKAHAGHGESGEEHGSDGHAEEGSTDHPEAKPPAHHTDHTEAELAGAGRVVTPKAHVHAPEAHVHAPEAEAESAPNVKAPHGHAPENEGAKGSGHGHGGHDDPLHHANHVSKETAHHGSHHDGSHHSGGHHTGMAQQNGQENGHDEDERKRKHGGASSNDQ